MPTLNVQTRPSQANQISILLAKEYNQIILSIENDGIEFDPSVFAREDTTGLRNMAERAKMLGGSLEVQSKVRQGTHLTTRSSLNRSPSA